ncbi:MAG: MFS transporter, partial [Betaproteobacteria bacterium]
VWNNPYFRSLAPLGFVNYGGLIAIQTLWAAPWMIRVAHYSPLQAAAGMFWLNLAMLCSFWLWGMVNPVLARRGLHVDRLIALGLPVSFIFLGLLVAAGPRLGSWTTAVWAFFCMGSTFVSLAQPAVAMAFPAALAGRALSAYNLVLFIGIFVVQWGVGLAVDAFQAFGLGAVGAFQCAMALYLLCSVASYGYFVASKPHNHGQ